MKDIILWHVGVAIAIADEMATSVKYSREDNDADNERNPAVNERTSTMLTNETEQQEGQEDTALQKPQLSEPCIS